MDAKKEEKIKDQLRKQKTGRTVEERRMYAAR